MKDPYKVLGVPPDASDDEIKKAYRALARKYHPDNYNGSDLADLAEEKMKEVNEAYDAVKKMRETGQSYSGQSSSSSSSGGYSGGLAEARRLIAAGSYANAELILDSISVNERGMELPEGLHHAQTRSVLRRAPPYRDRVLYGSRKRGIQKSPFGYGRLRPQVRSGSDAHRFDRSMRCVFDPHLRRLPVRNVRRRSDSLLLT